MLNFSLNLSSIPKADSFPGVFSASVIIWFRISSWSLNSKLHIKPSEPCSNVIKGGIMSPLNCFAAHRMVPSPPSVTMKSIDDLNTSSN